MTTLTDTTTLLAGPLRTIANPLDGVVPDFTIFGAEFTELWQQVLGGLWGIAIVIAVVFVIVGLVTMGKAGGSNPHSYKEGQTQLKWALISLAGLAALAVGVGAILALVG